MKIGVLLEYDTGYGVEGTIGVVDSDESAEKLIAEYYGDFVQLEHNEDNYPGNGWTKKLEVRDHNNDKITVIVSLDWYVLNKC